MYRIEEFKALIGRESGCLAMIDLEQRVVDVDDDQIRLARSFACVM